MYKSNQSLLQFELNLSNTIEAEVQKVKQYANPVYIKKAQKIIPFAELHKRVENNLRNIENNDKNCMFQDLLVFELMKWFKYEYFSWVDSPICEQCSRTTVGRGVGIPSNEDILYGANKIEVYECIKCNTSIKFPRYNNCSKLLDTRKGRCGEWGNCFTFLCNALGIEARLIIDLTDHVWTEVYSEYLGRWVHCDCCENVWDKPLIYEAGWGKKISYIFAFSPEEVQDVTWRYTSNFDLVCKRRNDIRESWLSSLISKINTKLQINCSPNKKQQLLKRLVLDLASMLVPKCVQEEDKHGRTSGSLAWRLSRGEIHVAHNPVILFLTEEEVNGKIFSIKYCCASDSYIRGNDQILGWNNCVWNCSSIFRKEEYDWKMAYLARYEGENIGEIEWKFDASKTGLIFNHIHIKAQIETYENGEVSWELCGESENQKVKTQGCFYFDSNWSWRCSQLSLKAILTGGKGTNAWQHAQLFRQLLSDISKYPLEIIITLA